MGVPVTKSGRKFNRNSIRKSSPKNSVYFMPVCSVFKLPGSKIILNQIFIIAKVVISALQKW